MCTFFFFAFSTLGLYLLGLYGSYFYKVPYECYAPPPSGGTWMVEARACARSCVVNIVSRVS